MKRFLSKFSIALQLTLLACFVAALSSFLVSEGAMRVGKDAIREHEISDLGAECNLRMFEVREDVRYLGHELRQFGSKLSPQKPLDRDAIARLPLAALFKDRIEGGKASSAQAARTALRRRDLDGPTYLQACLLKVDARGNVDVVAAVEPSKGGLLEGNLRPVSQKAFADVAEQIRKHWERRPKQALGLAQQYQSVVSPLNKMASPGRQALTIAYPIVLHDDRPVLVLALTIDFTRLIWNQARRSPRHLFFVTDAGGNVLFPQQPDRARKPLKDFGLSFAGAQWDKGGLSKADVEERGARSTEAPLGTLEFFFLKKPLGKDYVRKHGSELNQKLLELSEESPDLRFREITANTHYLELSHPDKDALRLAADAVGNHEKAKGVARPETGRVVDCKTMVAHLVKLSLDAAGTDPPLGLVLGAAIEEIDVDFNAARNDLRIYRIAPVLFVGALLALLLSYALTTPLRRITAAARRLARGDLSVDLPVRGPGEVGELARAFRDMIEQIRRRDLELRENLARLNTILTTAADGILTCDERGRIEQANQSAERMFGYPAQGLQGARVQGLLELPANLLPSPGMAATGSIKILQAVIHTPTQVQLGRRKDGTTFWMEVAFSQVPVGDRRVITGIFRDVTRRREAEEKIKKLNDELEVRVQLRTAQLEDAKGKLEVALTETRAANTAKSAFIRNLSHELRTPLTSIMGFTDLLLSPRPGKTIDPAPNLQKIRTASNHLLALINDLLDVARHTSGQPIPLEPSEFALNPFVQGVLDMVAPLLRKNANQLAAEVSPDLGVVRSDEKRLRQVLFNLLSNSSKFTEKGRIGLAVFRQTGEDGDWVVFTVTDTGIGMTPEQLRNLFRPFYRVDDSTTRKAGGTGLGLSITKMICEVMGGGVEVQSTHGQGSTFIVRLPARLPVGDAPGPAAPAPETASPAPTRAPRQYNSAVVIEDDPLTGQLLSEFLQQEGLRACLATTGEEGLRLARAVRPAVITLDVQMPGMDGWAVLAALKCDDSTSDVPVILLTISEDRTRGYALGAAEYVAKPIDWERLRMLLRKYSPTASSALIVEDDALQRDCLRQSMEHAGWTVYEASNGREGLQKLDHKPAVILLDLMMPGMDGFEFLEELRRLPNGRSIPVVVLTAKDLSAEERRRLQGSVEQVLAKGAVSREELLVQVRQLLQRYRAGSAAPGGA